MAKNSPKWQNSVCHTSYPWNYILYIWLAFMVHMCKMIISPEFFFHFFKTLNFWVVRGVKRQKLVQNDKTFCPSRLISQEPYITWWLSFMVHICKVIYNIFRCDVHFSKILIFWVHRGAKGQKMVPEWQKIMSVALRISGTIHHMIVTYGANV